MGRRSVDPVLSRASYSDIADLMDTAVELGGIKHAFPTEAAAIHKLQRMNMWRIYNRKAGVFKYDRFIFRRNANVVSIEPRDGLQGVTMTLDDKPIKVLPPPPSLEEIEAATAAVDKGLDPMTARNKIRIEKGLPPLRLDEPTKPMKLDIEVDND